MKEFLFDIGSISSPAQDGVLYMKSNLGQCRHLPNHLKNGLGKLSQQSCNAEMKEIQTQTLPMKIPDYITGPQSS